MTITHFGIYRKADIARYIKAGEIVTGISMQDIIGVRKFRHMFVARALTLYAIRQEINISLTQLGSEFSDRDHTSILNAINRAKAMIAADPEARQVAQEIITTAKAMQ